ncbi:MAG TPA: class F sortase [Ktedonobacteraceae bacterium]|nr:class F sortase [Ktedonobacteraceae bacterium]
MSHKKFSHMAWTSVRATARVRPYHTRSALSGTGMVGAGLAPALEKCPYHTRSAPTPVYGRGRACPRPALAPALGRWRTFVSMGRIAKVVLLLLVLLLALACSACSQTQAARTQQYTVSSLTTNQASHRAPTATVQVKALPIRLSIPAIGVNAPVEPVGVGSNGDLAVPAQKTWEDVGWYKSGPSPGEKGSAVIDGHLDRPGGSPAVFWRLRDLRVGNEVLIIDVQGKTLRFRVTDIAYYPPQSAPIEQIFANPNGRYLNLITCAGDWIESQHQTTLRLVVYTSLE